MPLKTEFHDQKFRYLDLSWVMGLLLTNVIVQAIYGVQVCPYIEGLSWSEILIANFSFISIAFLLRLVLHNYILISDPADLSKKQLIAIDVALFLLSGTLWGVYNLIWNEFPIHSAFKVITGFLSIGVLTGILLHLVRKVKLLKENLISRNPESTKENYHPISKDILAFALIILGLVLLNGIFLIVKDLRWIITLEESQFSWATQSIIVEILFVAGIYATYIVVISFFYSRYLKLQLKNQTNILDAVSRGILNENANIIGNDEFSVVAKYTNKMIDQLRVHTEISKSIEYTRNLQNALLPSKKMMDKNLENYFVYFKPRDIISGDFYWTERIDHFTLFAVADSTGHGVPGAMVSIVCINALNRAVKEYGYMQPAMILNKTRELVAESFQFDDRGVKDGMDISLCVINTETKELQWAGAYNPLWVISQREMSSAHYSTSSEYTGLILSEFNADRQPIGFCDKNCAFTNHKMQLNTGDRLYLFSDGYVDQFGGNRGKKLKKSGMKNLLLSIASNKMEEQFRTLGQHFNDWKGDLDQIDDICVLGYEV